MALHDKLRAERTRRGWTRLEMARRLTPHVSDQCPDLDTLQAYVKRWEAGKVGISERYRFAYAATFETDLDALPDPTGDLNPDDEERLIKAAQRPFRVDASVIELFATILAAQRRTEDVIGSGPLLGPVRAQLTMMEQLIAEARGTIRTSLLDVGAQWGQFAGWLHAGNNQADRAMAYLGTTLDWATETGDRAMVGAVMSWKGYVAERAGQVGAMIGLSQVGQRSRDRGGRVYDLYQEARGHALRGSADQVDRLVDEAAEEAEQLTPEDIRPWEYYYLTPGFFTMEHGVAYRILGRSLPDRNADAIEYLTQGLSSLPVEMRGSEWSGEFIYQLGRAHLQAGERDEAGRLAGELTSLGERLGSDRLIRQAEALAAV
ncbi:helix-turn-helix transcriptional regulator [Actinomadura barringtoniae]|uniref:Helix-turn-helix transcriptional regulator n=1 Tax=Actinomadura barringtoniae TaxID=1427535 RepID=A0A939TEZ9_9ACTN|nr:helix-turn-helix transcriptional regulator [Actinomadura barringtoniae]MBO2453865.1 helix-turn-helix transcriptional regulator [Actinomadura barringtoniae]